MTRVLLRITPHVLVAGALYVVWHEIAHRITTGLLALAR